MTDVMVDTETTHTDPAEGGVLQLAAIKFNYATKEIGDIFDRCPAILPRRTWSDGTRDFWRKHMDVYKEIVAREEPAYGVYRDFADWINQDPGFEGGGLRFWAAPVKFDWPIIEGQYIDLGLQFPFAHWNQIDMRSFMCGLTGSPEPYRPEIPFNGKPHNALHDCAHQLEELFYVKDRFVPVEIMN